MAPAAASPQQVSRRAGGPGDRAPARPVPSEWLFPLVVFAAAWLLIQVTWYVSTRIYGQRFQWTRLFLFKDSGWYLTIAEHGYPGLVAGHVPGTVAFFPLFPLTVRLASYLTGGNYVIAGLVVTVLAGAASAVGVWAVAARVCDRHVADRAVLLYCLFPGAMVFGMLYSEGLNVALGAAVLLALLSRRWLLAGIVGAAATAEAPMLIIVVGVTGIAAVQAIWLRREWRALIAPALAPLGVLAYFGYLGHRYHDYAFWFQAENSGWGQHIDWGRKTLAILTWTDEPGASQNKLLSWVYIIMLVAAAAGIILTLAARLPLPVSLYGILIVLTFTLSPANPRPRYLLCAFPLFIGAAAKLPRIIYWPVLVLSSLLLIFLTGWWPHHVVGPAP